jgi:hypothetical protein
MYWVRLTSCRDYDPWVTILGLLSGSKEKSQQLDEIMEKEMNLTKNFTFEEMTKSETALRFSMGNHPGDTELQNLIILCEEVLQPIRNHYNRGVKVNSGYRHPSGKR